MKVAFVLRSVEVYPMFPWLLFTPSLLSLTITYILSYITHSILLYILLSVTLFYLPNKQHNIQCCDSLTLQPPLLLIFSHLHTRITFTQVLVHACIVSSLSCAFVSTQMLTISLDTFTITSTYFTINQFHQTFLHHHMFTLVHTCSH